MELRLHAEIVDLPAAPDASQDAVAPGDPYREDGQARVQRLRIDYATTNDLEVDVYVMHYVDYFPVPRPSAYVFYAGHDTLTLVCGTLPDPPRTRAVHPGRPWAQKLAPGQPLQARLELPVPVLEAGKFQGADPGAPHERRSVSIVRMLLAIQPRRRELQVTDHDELSIHDVWGVPPTWLQAQARLSVPCPVLRRTDDFHRPG